MAQDAADAKLYPFPQRSAPVDRDPALVYAWDLYASYSSASKFHKDNNTNIRQFVILLIFLTSFLAVLADLRGPVEAWQWVERSLSGISPLNAIFTTPNAKQLLQVLLIVLPITTAAFLSFATQFSPLRAWIIYRVGAEDVRREIYLYRFHAGEDYSKPEQTEDDRRDILFQRLKAINNQVQQKESIPPVILQSNGEKPRWTPSLPRRIFMGLTAPFRWVLWHIYALWMQVITRKRPEHPIQTAAKKSEWAGRYHKDIDDGFKKITPLEYLAARVTPQRDWYVNKIAEDQNRIADWRILILSIGIVSAVLAAANFEPWIVVTTAASIAFSTHIQLNLIGSNYGLYHLTVSKLDAEIAHWQAMNDTERERKETAAHFVLSIENIIREESDIWEQQASQIQTETEQALIKGNDRRGATGT